MDKIGWISRMVGSRVSPLLLEHFINWMNFATVQDWVKLWGVIDQDMEPGNYVIEIENCRNFFCLLILIVYEVSSWNGRKALLFKTINQLGGTARFIGFFLLTMGNSSNTFKL